MRKLLSVLLALCLMLSCPFALTAGAPMVFEQLGFSVEFEDVIEATPYYTKPVSLGIFSRSPFVACLDLNIAAMDKEEMQEILDHFDSFDPEKQEKIRKLTDGINAILASVIVTDAGKEQMDSILQDYAANYDRAVEVIEFGCVEPYRYYAVTLPGFTESEYYDFYRDLGTNPDEVRIAYPDFQAEAIKVRDAFVERLKTAELYTPVDPMNGLIGQILSFETTDLDGNPVSSADLFRENKVTMINLWGSWCQNCLDELSELAKIHERLREKGCGIIGLDSENEPIETVKDKVRTILEKNVITYPNVIQPKGHPVFNDVHVYPSTFFVDSEGRILTKPIVGVQVDKYEIIVDQLLSEVQVDMSDQAGVTKNDSGAYRVIVCDKDGHPVEGAVIQMCDDSTCAFQLTGADGIAVFSTEEQKVYEIHVLKTPEGYAPNQEEYRTLEAYSDVTVFLEKAE